MQETGGSGRLVNWAFGISAGDRIVATAAPGMAAAYPAGCQPASTQCAVRPDGIQRVFGATRREPTAPQRPEQQRFRWGNHPAIQAHAKSQNMLDRIHSACSVAYLNNLAFRTAVKKSRSTSANPLPAMDGRATSTRSTGAASLCR
jgi:hypothetical protein